MPTVIANVQSQLVISLKSYLKKTCVLADIVIKFLLNCSAFHYFAQLHPDLGTTHSALQH